MFAARGRRVCTRKPDLFVLVIPAMVKGIIGHPQPAHVPSLPCSNSEPRPGIESSSRHRFTDTRLGFTRTKATTLPARVERRGGGEEPRECAATWAAVPLTALLPAPACSSSRRHHRRRHHHHLSTLQVILACLHDSLPLYSPFLRNDWRHHRDSRRVLTAIENIALGSYTAKDN